MNFFKKRCEEKAPALNFDEEYERLIKYINCLDDADWKGIKLSKDETLKMMTNIDNLIHITLPKLFKECSESKRNEFLDNLGWFRSRKYNIVGGKYDKSGPLKILNSYLMKMELQRTLRSLNCQPDPISHHPSRP